MHRTSDETTLAGRLLTPRYEPSIDELLNDPVAEAIMRYDRITREDVCRVISQVIVRRGAGFGSSGASAVTPEIYASLTKGFNTPDLTEAKALLNGLR